MNNLKLVSRTVAAVAKRQGGRTLADHAHPESYVPRKTPHFNDLPIPQGSWKDAYAAKQRRYNAQLLVFFSLFAGSAIYVFTNNYIDLTANRPDLSSVVKK